MQDLEAQEDNDLVAIGRVRRAVGLKGGVEVELYSGDMSRLESGTTVLVGDRKLEVSRIALGRKKLFSVTFEGIEVREEAEALRGKEIEVPESSVPPAPEGTYYHYQLIGSEVRDENGAVVGTLSGIIETGANDVYVISTFEGDEILVPATRSRIRFVDTVERVVGVNLQDEAVSPDAE